MRGVLHSLICNSNSSCFQQLGRARSSFFIAMSSLRDKFRGAMVGGLLGDCLGAPFEWRKQGRIRPDEAGYIFKTEDKSHHWDYSYLHRQRGNQKGYHQKFRYTDDTAMAFAIAESVTQKKELDSGDIALNFVREYQADPHRGYSRSVRELLSNMGHVEDVFAPARQQFHGQGSKGNGAAMRTHPLALMTNATTAEEMELIVREVSKLTHTHEEAIQGAYLQTMAIRCCLNFHPNQTGAIVRNIREYARGLEAYGGALDQALCNGRLRNGVLAIDAVPTAIHFALKMHHPQSQNYFTDVLHEVYKLGEDTDTIGCMAGAIAGALIGYKRLPQNVLRSCEGVKRAVDLADDIYKIFARSEARGGYAEGFVPMPQPDMGYPRKSRPSYSSSQYSTSMGYGEARDSDSRHLTEDPSSSFSCPENVENDPYSTVVPRGHKIPQDHAYANDPNIAALPGYEYHPDNNGNLVQPNPEGTAVSPRNKDPVCAKDSGSPARKSSPASMITASRNDPLEHTGCEQAAPTSGKRALSSTAIEGGDNGRDRRDTELRSQAISGNRNGKHPSKGYNDKKDKNPPKSTLPPPGKSPSGKNQECCTCIIL